MKKYLGKFLVLSLITLFVFTLIPLKVSAASKTVTDQYGNRYYVEGTSHRYTKSALVITSFSVTYYNGGNQQSMDKVNAYPKTLRAKGSVSLAGGGSNTFGDSYVTKTGKFYNHSSSDSYIYKVTGLNGTHNFSCKGATWSGTSSN